MAIMITSGMASDAGLGDQQHVNPDQRRGEGEAEVAEDVDGDLPLPFAGEIHRDSPAAAGWAWLLPSKSKHGFTGLRPAISPMTKATRRRFLW